MVSFPIWMVLFMIAGAQLPTTASLVVGSKLPSTAPLIGPEVCQKSDKCFFIYASNQCFCFPGDPKGAANKDWKEAEGVCNDKIVPGGYRLKLPHPTDVVALRNGLFQYCGNCGDFWMDAGYFSNSGKDGMYWQDVEVEITCNNPYFASPQRRCPIFGAGDCLVMRVDEVVMKGNDLNRPYFTADCTDSTKHKHILCEKIASSFPDNITSLSSKFTSIDEIVEGHM